MSDSWNKTDLVFTDISVEESRTYVFDGGGCVKIDFPTHLHVSASGGHRLVTADGRGIYVPAGFLMIEWKPKPGAAIFVA